LRAWAAPASLLALAAILLWGIPSPCPLRFVFGIPCPSCGMTRAARAALAFDFAGATRAHPLWFIVLPAVALFAGIESGAYALRGRTLGLDRMRSVRVAALAIVILLVGVWIARFFGAFGGPSPV
jgi:hypothetical protein